MCGQVTTCQICVVREQHVKYVWSGNNMSNMCGQRTTCQICVVREQHVKYVWSGNNMSNMCGQGTTCLHNKQLTIIFMVAMSVTVTKANGKQQNLTPICLSPSK